MPYPENLERNKGIVDKRQRKWTFSEIGKFYGIHRSTAHNIYKRMSRIRLKKRKT